MSNQYMIVLAYWCVSEICFLAMICFLCENILKIRNKTEVLTSDIIMNYNISDTARNQAKTLKEVLDAWPMNNVVYGMFEMNINLPLKYINISTTYLILVIQVSHFI